MKLALSALVAAMVSAFASVAVAQEQRGFALNRFEPSERGSEWFASDSLDLRGHVRPAAGLVLDYGHKPLVLYRGDDEQSAVVARQLFAHAGGSLVLWNRVRAGLSLPIALHQDGDGPFALGRQFTTPGTNIGDLRLSADVRLLGAHGKPINVAAGASVWLPTGSREDYTGDGYVRFAPHVAIAGDIEKFTYAARLGFQYRGLTERFDTNPLGSELTFSASAGARLVNGKLVVGPELYGSTVTNEDSFFEKKTTPLEWLLGAHYGIKSFRFGAGIGTGLSRGFGTPVFRALLSAEWTPEADKDTDGDGIFDKDDACPTVAGVRSAHRRTNGCPLEAPRATEDDHDGDGILDKEDACPEFAGVRDKDPKRNGCPPDRDGDGIEDTADACPEVRGPKSADRTKNGCPPDRDGDGIPDAADACPEEAGSPNSDALRNGCPTDRDGDGVYDKEDNCPDAPGPADPDPKRNGCPMARVEDGEIKISEQVRFKNGSAEILADSDPVLFAVAALLKGHPEITAVRVEGHTDARGKPESNRLLSYNRAVAVVSWMVAAGIPKARFTATGFGSARSIDTNDTDEGRQHNRRVEFHIDRATKAKP